MDLPSTDQCGEAIAKFDRIWVELVPRSARPLRKGDYLEVRRVLEHVHALTANAANGHASPADGEEQEEGDESPIRAAMRALWALDPEEWEAAKILMSLRALSEDIRHDVFDEIQIAHCMKCAEEVAEGEEHACSTDADVEEADAEEEAADANGESTVDSVHEQRDDSSGTK